MPHANVVVYTMKGCPWCEKAEALLKKKKIPYSKKQFIPNVHKTPPKMPNGEIPNSFPKIWVAGKSMGGFDNMQTWITHGKIHIGPRGGRYYMRMGRKVYVK